MKSFCHPDWALLPEALFKQAPVYFFYGNFYRLIRWEDGEYPETSSFLRDYYRDAGGQSYWGFKFDRDRVMHTIASQADEKLFGASSISSALVQYNLGRYFHFRPNASVEHLKKALFWYHLSAQQGYPLAMLSLAYCYRKGIGISADLGQSVQWEQTYNAHRTNRAFHLTSFPCRCQTYDIAAALCELEQRAHSGCLVARMQLAYCYLYGLGVAQDLKLPLQWCEKTIQQLENKHSEGKHLFTAERLAQQAALELLGCYQLQGVKNLIQPSFWKATALKIMSTSYQWERNSAPSDISAISLTDDEKGKLAAFKADARQLGLEQDEREIRQFSWDSSDWTQEQRERVEEFYLLRIMTNRAKAIAKSVYQYHPLQLKRTYAQKLFIARHDILASINYYAISKAYCEIKFFLFGYPAKEPLKCCSNRDPKFWIFHIQTPGLNLVFEHLTGRYLKPDGLKLAFLADVGQRTFQLSNCLLSGTAQQLRAEAIYRFFEAGFSLKIAQYGLKYYKLMAQDHKKGEKPSLERHALSGWPSSRTIQMLVEAILKKRVIIGAPSQLFDCTAQLVDPLLPATEFEACLQEPAPERGDNIGLEFVENFWEPATLPYWCRRQHLLLMRFLTTSFYVHDPWIKKEPSNHAPYRPDLQKLERYLRNAYEPESAEAESQLLQRLSRRLRRNARSIPKPEFFYPALGWSKYWKQALLTLTPFEKIERLDCAPFKDGLFCSD